MQRAYDKVNDWLEWCALHEELINVQKGGYNLTLHPSSVRGTFPGLSPFRIIHSKDILHTLLELPSITTTSITSLLLGAAVTFLTLWSVNKSDSNNYMRNVYAAIRNSTRRSWCVMIISVLSYWVYVRQRRAKLRLVSGSINCSSSPRGPCNVTNNVLMITNSHAGTHADCPFHFTEEEEKNSSSLAAANDIKYKDNIRNGVTTNFSNAHYNGNVIVLDFSPILHKYDESAINTRVMQESLNALPDTIQCGEEPLWRLICITRRLRTYRSNEDAHIVHNDVTTTEDKWESTFAFFTVNAIVHLLERFPRLMLLATDAPSVDAPSASPIVEYVHGTLFASGVAIIENISGEPLYSLLGKSSKEEKSQQLFDEDDLQEEQQHQLTSHSAKRSVHHEKQRSDSCEQTTLFLRGMMSTTFNPMQDFRDSTGCSVVFFPAKAEHF